MKVLNINKRSTNAREMVLGALYDLLGDFTGGPPPYPDMSDPTDVLAWFDNWAKRRGLDLNDPAIMPNISDWHKTI